MESKDKQEQTVPAHITLPTAMNLKQQTENQIKPIFSLTKNTANMLR